MISERVWMENARLRLESARLLLDQGLYGESISRLYFAVFAAARALLVSRDLIARTHSGIHYMLYAEFSKQQVDATLYHRLWAEREAYDYELRIPNQSHIQRRYVEAEQFIGMIASIL